MTLQRCPPRQVNCRPLGALMSLFMSLPPSHDRSQLTLERVARERWFKARPWTAWRLLPESPSLVGAQGVRAAGQTVHVPGGRVIHHAGAYAVPEAGPRSRFEVRGCRQGVEWCLQDAARDRWIDTAAPPAA